MVLRAFGLFLVAGAGIAFAQESLPTESPGVPEETDIVLPTRLLQIDDIRVEAIDPVLPEPPEIVPPELAFPLPTDTELTISDEAFQVPDLPTEAAIRPGGEASVYSTGSVGFGTMNQVSGALTLYKLGTDPRFNFSFAHDSVDGYDFRSPGTGFFRIANTIDGWVGASSETAEFQSSASYVSVGEGLQGESEFYSVETQFLSADVAATFRPDPRVVLDVDLRAASARRLLTVPDTDNSARLDREVSLEPSFGVGLELDQVTAGIDLGYLLRAATGLSTLNAVSFDFSTDVTVSDALYLRLSLGVFWLLGERFEYPFLLGTSFSIRDRFTVGLSGGFEVDPVFLERFWTEISLASVGLGLEVPTRWFARTTVAWNLLPERLVLEATLDYSRTDASVSIAGWDAGRSEFRILQMFLEDLSARTEARWTPARGVTISGGVKSHILDRRVIDPAWSLDSGVRFVSPEGGVNAGASVTVPIYQGFSVPVVDLDGSIRVAEGVNLVLEANDLLSPLTEAGRAKYTGQVDASFPFIDPGLRVILKAQLSL